MELLFAALFLAAFAALVLGLVQPRWVGMKSRPQAFLVYLMATFICFVLFGMSVDEDEEGPGGLAADSVPQQPGGRGTDTFAGTGDGGGEPVGVYVLRADSGRVKVSSRRDVWARPYLVAELPPGGEVELLERTTAGGEERCRIRTQYPPLVAGWVMCRELVL